MGLLKSGMKYGSFAYIAHEAGKTMGTVSSKNQNQNTTQQQPQSTLSPAPMPTQYRSANGYLHQSWCNGQCNSHCNDSQNQARDQHLIQSGGAEEYYTPAAFNQQSHQPTMQRS